MKYWVEFPILGTLETHELAMFPGEYDIHWESGREFGGFLFHVDDHKAIVDSEYGYVSIEVSRILEVTAERIAREAA